MAINGTHAHLSKFSVSLNSSETPAIPRGVITCSPQFVSGIPARCSASDIIARGHCPRGLYICTKKKNQSGYDYEWIMQRPLSSSSPPRRAAGEEAVQARAKRPRAAQACDRCRLKKYKCDESYPCSHCKSMYYFTLLGKKAGCEADIVQKARLIVFIRGVIGSVKITDLPGTIAGDHAVLYLQDSDSFVSVMLPNWKKESRSYLQNCARLTRLLPQFQD